jgi:SIR2-like domain
MSVSETGTASAVDPEEFRAHLDAVVEGFKRGKVTPVLGAGVNLASGAIREDEQWLRRLPPSGRELAEYLARQFRCPPTASTELMLISQYICAVGGGQGPLYEELHRVFDVDFPTTPVHDFLARVPEGVRRFDAQPPLILTTNYDDLIERAFAARGEQFDLLVYVATDEAWGGRFCTRTPDGQLERVEDPKTNVDIDPNDRAVILKLHGFVDRGADDDDNEDSYVITEDDYIEYLARMDLDNLLPVKVLDRLRNCHFLFLGYSLADWNLRALLHRLSSERRRKRAWWAIQVHPSLLDRNSWRNRDVTIFDIPLREYVDALAGRFDELTNGLRDG